jgi:hypothetical protein
VRRTIAIAAIATLSLGGVVPALAASKPTSPPIPMVHAIHLDRYREGVVVGSARLSGHAARRLIRATNQMKPYPKGTAFPCPLDRGNKHEAATIRSRGTVWTVDVGGCGGIPFITKNNQRPRLYHGTDKFASDFRSAFSHVRPYREHVPASVHTAHLMYKKSAIKSKARRRTATGAKAAALVKSFDKLKLRPRNSVVCDIAGGPTTTVRFATKKHTWLVTQSVCNDIQVTRDGKPLPSLLPSRAWEKAVQAGLGK